MICNQNKNFLKKSFFLEKGLNPTPLSGFNPNGAADSIPTQKCPGLANSNVQSASFKMLQRALEADEVNFWNFFDFSISNYRENNSSSCFTTFFLEMQISPYKALKLVK